MTTPNTIPTAVIVDLHNDLVEEFRRAVREKNDLQGSFEDPKLADQDPTVNYARGKVMGFKMVLDAMQASAIASTVDFDVLAADLDT